MKKTIAQFILILATALPAAAQTTNGVKVSQLAGATLPLSGTELVALVQSGTTKQTAVSSLSASAVAAAAAAATALTNLISAEAAARSAGDAAATNAQTAISAAYAAGDAATSNALKSVIVSTSNTLATAAALLYPSNNPAGWQTAAQVTNTVTAALAAAGVGSTNLAVVQTTNLIFNPFNIGTNTAGTVNMNTASLQTFTMGTTGNSTLTLGNYTNGQQVTVFVYNPDTRNRTLTLPSGTLNFYGSTFLTVQPSKSALITLTSAGGQIIMQASAQP